MTTTQEWFGLPRAGGADDCRFDELYENYRQSINSNDNSNNNGAESGISGCNNYVLILHDKEAYPNDPDVINLDTSQTSNGDDAASLTGWEYIPDVFLSGAVHGNERVGPTALIEMSELLLESVACESLPRMRYQPTKNDNADSNDDGAKATTTATKSFTPEQWQQELSTAQSCRQSLTERGVPSPLRQWLARLVSTRRTVIIPTANALGYARNKREEGSIDPNRDFPFDIEVGREAECMQTIAGRSINELWRSHLFQIGLTFHGGMEVIGYEWGAPTYLNYDAPDALAQEEIAHAYSMYSNGFAGHVPYDFGTMNDKVYYVRGGMEDWAFAGSWDPERVVQCAPTTYGGYAPEKTVYNNSTLRAFNMLIETSDPKEPGREELGTRVDPLVSTVGRENGHVARNIRLALLAMDVVEPYVSIRGVEGLVFEDDVIPSVNLKGSGVSYYDGAKLVWVPNGGDGTSSTKKTITWTVGGSMTIDNTEIIYGLWDDLPMELVESASGFYPTKETRDIIDSKFRIAQPINVEGGGPNGRSRWHANGAFPTQPDGNGYNVDPIFEATIDIDDVPPGKAIAVIARAKVDQDWTTPAANVGPSGLDPASHIVNARTNPSYFASNGGKIIRGRENNWWYSDPITVVVGDADEAEAWDVNDPAASGLTHFSFSSDHDGVVTAIHMNARFSVIAGLPDSPPRSSNTNSKIPSRTSGASIALVVMLLMATGIFVRLLRSRSRRYPYQQAGSEAFASGDEFDPTYRDDIGDLELRIS